MASSTTSFMSATHKGRENFNNWHCRQCRLISNMKLCGNVFLGTETDAEKNVKAKSKLVLLIKPINYVHIKACTTAKQIWEKLQFTFQDSGLSRKVNLIQEMTNTKLEDCVNVEVSIR